MTLDEWIEVSAAVVLYWPRHQPTPEQVRMQHLAVVDLSKDEALAAVVSLARDGREFPPNSGQVWARARKSSSPGPLAIGAALDLFVKAFRVGHGDELAGLKWLQAENPVVARWVIAEGWSSLATEQIDHPDHGGAVRARLGASLKRVEAFMVDRQAAGQVETAVQRRIGSFVRAKQLDTGGG